VGEGREDGDGGWEGEERPARIAGGREESANDDDDDAAASTGHTREQCPFRLRSGRASAMYAPLRTRRGADGDPAHLGRVVRPRRKGPRLPRVTRAAGSSEDDQASKSWSGKL